MGGSKKNSKSEKEKKGRQNENGERKRGDSSK